jgi:hypothetical protein
MEKWVRGLGPSEIGLAACDIMFILVIPLAIAGIFGSILESYWNLSEGASLLVILLFVAAAGIYIRLCRKLDKE